MTVIAGERAHKALVLVGLLQLASVFGLSCSGMVTGPITLAMAWATFASAGEARSPNRRMG